MTGTQLGPRWAVVVSRYRTPAFIASVVLMLASMLVAPALGVPGVITLTVVITIVVFVGYVRVGTVHGTPRRVRPPVAGRWVAVNSPADKVPSHGGHQYAQTYAIDLIHVPSGEWHVEMHLSGPHTRAAEAYPAFGQPVFAVADGIVVKSKDTQRDHRARTSYLGFLLMTLEGMVLELTGRILGNYVILRLDTGEYAVVAHLRRGSVAVDVGERVVAGQQLGDCGNSGNTSEPHVHFHLMDRPSLITAVSVPFAFSQVVDDADDSALDVPRNYRPFRVKPSH